MLRIATWNLARPKERSHTKVPALRKQIQAKDADIWVLTETHDVVSPGPDYHGIHTVGSDREQQPGERWVAIWSRVGAIEPLPTSDPVRTCCARVKLSTGRDLLVYGTVLPWIGSKWGELHSADGAAFIAALEGQAADWRRLRAVYPEALFCVAGDLNQDLQEVRHYGSAWQRKHLLDALDSAGLTPVTAKGRDPVWTQTHGHRASVDHLCLCERLAAPASAPEAWPEGQEPDRKLSDHYGVSVLIGI